MNTSKNEEKPWYRTWFNSPYYHLLYKNRDEEEAEIFIKRLLKYLSPLPDSHFLDLACGRGRHSRMINKEGFQVTGADLSAENIKVAKRHENERLRFVQHDMRKPLDENSFNYVLNLFTSFGYFEKMEENELVLNSIKTELKPKGKVVLDFMNVNRVAHGLVPSETKEIEGVHFRISRTIENGCIIKSIKVSENGNDLMFIEKVKALKKEDFLGMFSRVGLPIIDMFGSYNLEKFDEDQSPRLILLASKP